MKSNILSIIHGQFIFKIILVCATNYYGSDCKTPCGQCKGDDVCDSVTGHCPNGCKPHWTGLGCDGKYATQLKQWTIQILICDFLYTDYLFYTKRTNSRFNQHAFYKYHPYSKQIKLKKMLKH